MIPFFIEMNYQEIPVPPAIIRYCDEFTLGASIDDLRFLDCVYMNMGLYGNDVDRLEEYRNEPR